MTEGIQGNALEAVKASGVLASLKRHEVTGESTALPLRLSADDLTADDEHKAPLVDASIDKSSVHAQRTTMIVRIEELLTSYGLDPNKKPALLSALDRLHAAHTNAEILAAITDISSIVTAAETSLPEIASPMTFADFEKKFDAAWSKYDRLEKETRTTMEEAARAGYISKENEDRSKQEQRNIEEHKKAIDVLTAKIHEMPNGVDKEAAEKEFQKKAHELANEIIQHANHDMVLIKQAIEAVKRDHNYALAKDLEEALPKKIEEAEAGTEIYDLGMTSATDKRQAALAKMKSNAVHERPNVSAKPMTTSTAVEPLRPAAVSDDLPEGPPKPTAFTTANASHGSLGTLSPTTSVNIPKPTGNSIA